MQIDTLLTRYIAHADPCGRNIKNNYIKAVLFTSATPTDPVKLPNQCRSKKTSDGAEGYRARRAAETADQRSKRLRKLRVRDHAKHATQTASEGHFTAKRYATEGKQSLRGERNEVTVDERLAAEKSEGRNYSEGD